MKIVTRQNNDNFKLVADVESCISMYRDLKLIDVKYTVISINEYTNQYTAFIHFEEINKPVETTNEQPKYPAIRYVFLN
jgi:hypothetical protein